MINKTITLLDTTSLEATNHNLIKVFKFLRKRILSIVPFLPEIFKIKFEWPIPVCIKVVKLGRT